MKICSRKKCSQLNPQSFTEFNKNKNSKDGLYPQCKACRKKQYVENIEHILKQKKEYNKRNREKSKKYCFENKVRRSKNNKKWYNENREKNTIKVRERRHKDITFRLLGNMRNRLRASFFGKGKSKKTLDLLGSDIQTAKNYLESLFQPGMTWDNYGEWEIDHKIPLSKAKDTEELEKLCHYFNLQPLWLTDNRQKGNRI
jgi:hypothetical protein